VRFRLSFSLLAVLICTQFASGTSISFTSSAAFLAATTITQTENYGTLTNGQLISSGATIDGLTYSGFVLTGGATQLDITNSFNSFSGLSLGASHTGATFFFGGEGATITFGAPVTAFGMFFNVNQNSGNYGFTSSSGSASTGSAAYDTSTFVFAGLTSTTPFSSISFSSTDTSLGSFNVPEVLLGSAGAVPEPSTVGVTLGGLAMLALGALRRRAV
jgi:hypothetical protein